MTTRILALLTLVGLSACVTQAPPVAPPSPVQAALEQAYRQQTPELLDAFFLTWEEKLPPITTAEHAALSPERKAVYEIFEAFYTPDDLARIGDSEWGSDIYAKYPYVAVQNTLAYTVVDQILTDSLMERGMFDQQILREETLADFRPRLAVADKRSVFLSQPYEQALTAFLGNELTPGGEQNLMSPAWPEGESQKRADFLALKIRVWPGHWGGWQIATHPRVSSIEINEALTEARVNFALIYEGGEAFFKQTEDGWTMTSSRLTWIQ